jgi:tetratricopeptide (TPR) repeat protein
VADLNANENAYEELVTVIEASQGELAILIAVCDDRLLRAQIIQRYETELSPDIDSVQLVLNRQEPSLRTAIANWLQENSPVQNQRLVLTITGAEELLWLNLQGEDEQPTQLDKFYGYLQWTREGLREFPYPIVLWVTRRILKNLSRRSPDFWSWRRGVYRFVAEESSRVPQLPRLEVNRQDLEPEFDAEFLLPLEDLLQLVARTEEQSGTATASLAALYDQLGRVYAQRVNRGEAEDLQEERMEAIACFRRAIELQEQFGLAAERMVSLRQLGDFYLSQSNYPTALEHYQQALEIAREIGDRQGEARSLGNLGNAYIFLGQYQQAIDFQQRYYDIAGEIGDRQGEAKSLGNLGNAYIFLGQYQQAIDFHQQSLKIKCEIGDRRGEAASLGNLGNAYDSLGQYQRATDFHQQCLDIARETGDRQVEAMSFMHLGSTYYSLGQYQRAIEFYQQSLGIVREIGYRQGEVNSIGNLGLVYDSLGQYERAINLYQQCLDIAQEIGDRWGEGASLLNMGLAFAKNDEHNKALQNYQQALAIYEDLQLDRMIEECKTAIAECNKLIAAQRITVPTNEPD